MVTLVLGASGATGKKLVDELLKKDEKVSIIVRPESNYPDKWNENSNLSIHKGHISDMKPETLASHLENCDAVASCLGHNLTFKGVFGRLRKLVTDAVRLVCTTSLEKTPEKSIKFVLMNTAGNSNRDLNEPASFAEKMVKGIIRTLVPPQSDNEAASDFLRTEIGQNNSNIEWCVVRPDSLINNEEVTEYTLHDSPTSSAIFKPGKTSRINVGNFMAELITDKTLWNQWKGKMPVIYNKK